LEHLLIDCHKKWREAAQRELCMYGGSFEHDSRYGSRIEGGKNYTNFRKGDTMEEGFYTGCLGPLI